MKVCQWGLENIWINHISGEVRMCGWTQGGGVIGNLLDNTIEELWHGERANRFRKSMLDGSYQYCNKKECPNCANGIVEKLYVEYNVPEFPKVCSLSYEEQCNYICKFCRKEKYIPNKGDKVKIEKIENEILKFLDKLDGVSANGVGEIFCSNSTINLLKKINTTRNMNVGIESNGSLFNEANWAKISNLGRYNLSVFITVHSFKEDTYQFLSGTELPITNIINNLKFISSLRKKNIINHFEIATVVCERNFREMPEYIEYCLHEFEPDKIRLRFFKPYGVRPLAIEWFYDVRNTEHPYHEEYVKVMQNPIFDNPKVWKWQGETTSDLEEHPYFMEKKKINMINYLLTTKNIARKIQTFLGKYEIKCFALYGNSVLAKILINIFDDNGIKFNDILDTYISDEYYKNHKIIQPNEENLKYGAVIITNISFVKEIENRLLSSGYKGKIIGIEDMICEIKNQNE